MTTAVAYSSDVFYVQHMDADERVDGEMKACILKGGAVLISMLGSPVELTADDVGLFSYWLKWAGTGGQPCH